MKKEESRHTPSTVFEGMTSIRAVISAYDGKFNDRRIKKILVDKDKRKKLEKELGWLKYKSYETGFEISFVSEEEISALTTGNTHGGIIAECTERTIPSLSSKDCETDIKKDGFYVMLEGIEDPYNFGYALRSLYACGADGVILPERNWMTAAGVVCRSSAGTSEMFPMYSSDPCEAADLFSALGYKIICAGIRNSVPSYEADMTNPVFLIVGGEKRGISSSLLAKADSVVRIEYGREFNSSLSAASAATVMGYEIMRQNILKNI